MLTRSVLIRHLGAILLANALLASSLIAPARAQVGPQEAAEFIQRAGGELAAQDGPAQTLLKLQVRGCRVRLVDRQAVP